MKLKNKISGEIKEFALFDGNELQGGATLESLTKEWCDCEEPKEYWFIDEFGLVQKEIEYYYEENKEAVHDKRIAVGNYFSSREEAEKAVEKLEALKRLRDKGFKFTGFAHKDRGRLDELEIYCQLGECPENIEEMDDVHLLFGVEE